MKFAIEGTLKTSFEIGKKVTFYCEAKGTPPLHYVWLHNCEVVDKRLENKLTVITGEETWGVAEYQCIVENLFGSKTSDVVKITVGESTFFYVL